MNFYTELYLSQPLFNKHFWEGFLGDRCDSPQDAMVSKTLVLVLAFMEPTI